MRTGWDPNHRNGVEIAKLAESTGIKSIAVHGRTRACMFRGNAEFETIRAIKSVVSIPVFANGDIGGPSDAARILNQTKADGVMIGRAALGQPWIFQQISSFLQTKVLPKPLSIAIRRDIILEHLDALYQLYGKDRGVRVARKHLSWYCRYLEKAGRFRDIFVRVETVSEQKRLTKEFFDRYDEQGRVAVQKRSREGVPDQCQRREPKKLRQENPLDLERTRKITRYRSGTDHLEA
jgi:tRNA-dihydrouridine synthase B